VIGSASFTKERVLQAINEWEKQDTLCPLSLATENSTCVKEDSCKRYNTAQERQDCRQKSDAYCEAMCPTIAVPLNFALGPNDDVCPCGGAKQPKCRTIYQPKPSTTCMDSGCITLQGFNALGNNNNNNNANDNCTGDAPDSAFEFEPFKISSVASSPGGNGPKRDSSGNIISASALFGYYALASDPIVVDGDETEPLATEWERQALCVLGIKYSERDTEMECKEDDLFVFAANFQRSLTDEFGNAIRGDLAFLISSYMLIGSYMFLMLSKRDAVYSGCTLGGVTLAVVGFSVMGGIGLGAFLGLRNNQLNNNLWFLILGLGVDDAFVLSAEFRKARKENPGDDDATLKKCLMLAARHGGMSILITSATDALAFLVGSATVLPALSWFCAFAGFAVIICFTLQITLFLPTLYLRAKCARDNRFDCCCCCKSKAERKYGDELGCCTTRPPRDGRPYCMCIRCPLNGFLERRISAFGRVVTTKVGAILTILLFTGVLGGGVAGCTQIYKDFKLEWFFPDDSYVNVFFQQNRDYFATGTPFSVYLRDIDYFKAQRDVLDLFEYVNGSETVEGSEVGDWLHTFRDFALDQDDWANELNTDGTFKDEATFYNRLHEWYRSGGGRRYQGSMQWVDPRCEDDSKVVDPNATTVGASNEKCPPVEINACDDEVRRWDNCKVSSGLAATRMDATFKLQYTDKGDDRYETMEKMRRGVSKIISNAFPYSFQFLYWEEVGIIDQELMRNLIICGAVVLVMVGLMIPHPRIAIWVALAIVLSVVNLVGYMHWWGITISGVSTIYILISVGLAVDYSAHIAHMFVVSRGTAPERAVLALERIGPSVFNAIVSTLLAVLMIGFSKSYVFRIFFKALFLTVILGGTHGMCFLPAVLSLFGGSSFATEDGEDSPRQKKNAIAAEEVELAKQNGDNETKEETVNKPDSQIVV